MVKRILKFVGITLSQFSNDLNISRPTLDSYIELFENGCKISNSFYQEIFEFLFDEPNISEYEFIKRYQYMRNHYGMSSDTSQVMSSKLKSGFNLPKSEYLTTLEEVQEIIERDKMAQDSPLELYKLFLISLKIKTTEFNDLYKFYIYYYGIEPIAPLSDAEKKLFSRLFIAYKEGWNQNNDYDPAAVANFTKHCTDVYNSKDLYFKKIKEALEDKISSVLLEEQKKFDLSNLSIEQALELVKKKL